MQDPSLTEVSDRSKTPGWKRRCREELSYSFPLPPLQLEYLPSLSFFFYQRQGSSISRKAAHLRVVDTQGLDLVKGKQDTDKEHLMLFLKGQGKAIDDATS